MAKLVIGNTDYFSKICKDNKNNSLSKEQITLIKSYYAESIKKNSIEVNSILSMGREAASKIFVR